MACSKAEFRSALVKQNPALKVILITPRDTVNGGPMMGTDMWKKATPEWVHRSIPYYSYWDVLNGAYDDLY